MKNICMLAKTAEMRSLKPYALKQQGENILYIFYTV